MTMKVLRSFLAVSLLAMGTASCVQEEPKPLFDAFKSFCADTDMTMGGVRAAVEAKGGKPTDDRLPNFDMEAWDVTVEGHALGVSATADTPDVAQKYKPYSFIFPLQPDEEMPVTQTCMVTSHEDEPGSEEALKEWIGVEATLPRKGVSPTHDIHAYLFLTSGSQHLPAPTDEAALDKAKADGTLWAVMSVYFPKSGTINLIHFLPETNKQ
jgi:hypothetical protein